MDKNDGRVVSNFIVQALRNEDITLYGDGQQTRSFCFVSDLIKVITSLMDSEDSITGPMNIGNPFEITVKELAERIVEQTDSKSKITYLPLPQDDPKQRCPDISKAKEELGWEPVIDIETGLAQTIDYFKTKI